ncbi:uncharacterized protein Pyn_36228 [Prunus yedoensis var. nudiflora]|uniref:Uncharacterized protein n=1 Tax=Prunus yedoensis var. nudiflora TaxID=2094558 RepID=A0A314Y1U6_PRUYE|nr:uncharacterized protein Pyn_36228 [Prunus yedoensis var. nudiflora]
MRGGFQAQKSLMCSSTYYGLMCSSTYYGLMLTFIINEPKDWDLKTLHMQASGNEEIEEIKQSRYAEYYLGLSIIWFKARWASDPNGLIHLIISKFEEGDHIIEKLVNETEEDFRLRRFTESFKQLQFITQEDVVERILDIVTNDPCNPIAETLSPLETEEEIAQTSLCLVETEEEFTQTPLCLVETEEEFTQTPLVRV